MRWLVTDDMLGLGDPPSFKLFNVVREYAFVTDEVKLAAFRREFDAQVAAGLLEVDDLGKPWTEQYVTSAYTKGQRRAYFDVRKETRKKRLPFYGGMQAEFLGTAFFGPEAVSKIALLASRSFSDLKGISDATGQQINRLLADGMLKGQNPRTIARLMTQQIDKITRTRALTLARTEIIHAHAEGQLDAFVRLGVQEVGIQAEWQTAGDDRVCIECDEMDGTVLPIEEARGLIPLHPNCRCAWIPVVNQSYGRRAA